MKKLIFLLFVTIPAFVLAQVGPGPIVSDGTTINPSRVNTTTVCLDATNKDTGITRDAAGVFDFGTCTQGDKSGTLKPATLALGDGTVGAPSMTFAAQSTSGIYRRANLVMDLVTNSSNNLELNNGTVVIENGGQLGFNTGATGLGDTFLYRSAASTISVSSTGANPVNGTLVAAAYNSGTNCNSSASPAVCGSAIAGSVALASGGTTLVVNTTAVTANSQILLTDDSSLGTRLSVTCNTTIPTSSVSARTAGTSFTITVAAAPVTNPACFSYLIVN